jgi:hypothetical protein
LSASSLSSALRIVPELTPKFASQFVLVWQCNAGLPIAACDALQHGAEDLQA